MYVVCTCVWDETPSYLHQEGGRARYQQSLIMSAWLDSVFLRGTSKMPCLAARIINSPPKGAKQHNKHERGEDETNK